MRKLILSLILSIGAFTISAQNPVLQNCIGYQVFDNTVVFSFENNQHMAIKVLSESMLKIHYPKQEKAIDKNFATTSSYAVVNEALGFEGKINIEESQQAYEFYTARLRVRINKSPYQLQIFDKYQKLLLSDYNDKGLVKKGEDFVSYKTLRNDEQFFGLGEKAGALNRRGKEFTMWNSDKPCYGVYEDPLYKSIPFFFSNYKYGIFFDNTYKTKFKFGTESNEYFSYETPGGDFTWYFIAGVDYKNIISQYIDLTGKPIMPPKWGFGFSQSRGMYTFQDQALEIAAEFRKRQIPIDIIYQDIGWVEYLQNFEWRKERYSNPKEMLQKLDAQGFKMIISQDPVVSQAGAKQWKEADSLGYFAKDIRTGKSYDMPWPWGGNCGVVDFTNPAVADWWGKLQQIPLSDGVRGFWTDMGEPAWSNEVDVDRLNMQHHDGLHDEIHNVYGLQWDKVVKEQFEKHNPGKRVFQMTRAAYAGLQRYTFGWSGDSGNGDNVLEGWGQFANQVAMGLSAGMGGIPFWTTDISGYCGDIMDHLAMSELYVRWMQFGIFNPLSRAHHEGDNAVEPWMFGEEAEKISKTVIEFKYQLFPYIYTQARVAHETGIPIMRAMFLEYPNDPEVYKVDDQFMFGESMLVAPVTKKGAVRRNVYLPEGEWIDYNNPSKIYDGEQTIQYPVSLTTTPIFIKNGSIIPMMPVMQYIHEKKDYPILLYVSKPNESQSSSFQLYDDDGESTDYLQNKYSTTRFEVKTKNNIAEINIHPRENKGYEIEGKRAYVIKMLADKKPSKVFVNQKQIKSAKIKSIDELNNQIPTEEKWYYHPTEQMIYVTVLDRQSISTISIQP